ncbi:MAG: SDR family NAD(P)-dependent oxidoreductase [Prevotella sp.]|nr:SDR family NAD(P)-dependent oxidoreductase [Prevotella sp.]
MKKIIIMGASSGIGYAVAEALASRGVRVGLAARHTSSLLELKKKYSEYVEYEHIDVTHADAPDRLEDLIETLGGMDIYFHVAGIGADEKDIDPRSEAEIIQTNAGGFARMTSAAYRYFRAHGGKGQIAAVTSVAGTNGLGRLPAYSASKKCAQTYLTALEQLAYIEGVKLDITDIRPGWIRTPLLEEGKKYPMEMTIEYVLPYILRAIVKKDRIAYVDWRWELIAKGWKRIPDRLWTKMNIELGNRN